MEKVEIRPVPSTVEGKSGYQEGGNQDIRKSGLSIEWIPVFTGMTNISVYSCSFVVSSLLEKTNPICCGHRPSPSRYTTIGMRLPPSRNDLMCVLKKQSQFSRSMFSYGVLAFSVLGAAIWRLKKQSQFSKGKKYIKSFLKGNYGNNPPCGA